MVEAHDGMTPEERADLEAEHAVRYIAAGAAHLTATAYDVVIRS